MGAGMTTSGLDDLVARLELVPDEVVDKAERIVGQGCNNIKRATQKRWRGIAHLPHLPGAVTYDVTRRGYVITGEVGPDQEKLQGRLGWIPEHGTPTSAPIPGLAPSLEEELPRFERYVDQLAAEAFR